MLTNKQIKPILDKSIKSNDFTECLNIVHRQNSACLYMFQYCSCLCLSSQYDNIFNLFCDVICDETLTQLISMVIFRLANPKKYMMYVKLYCNRIDLNILFKYFISYGTCSVLYNHDEFYEYLYNNKVYLDIYKNIIIHFAKLSTHKVVDMTKYGICTSSIQSNDNIYEYMHL